MNPELNSPSPADAEPLVIVHGDAPAPIQSADTDPEAVRAALQHFLDARCRTHPEVRALVAEVRANARPERRQEAA